MKTTVTLVILLTLFSLTVFAQTQLSLPEDIKVRIGEGHIYEIAFPTIQGD